MPLSVEEYTVPSVVAHGTATAPGAAGAVATSAAVGVAGYYEVTVVVGFGGTAESTAIDNFELKQGTAVVSVVPVANAANSQASPLKFVLYCQSTDTLSVAAVAAASAGAIYKATIVANRLGA